MEFFTAIILMIIFLASSYRFSSVTNAFYPKLKEALLNDKKVQPNDVISLIDYMQDRLPYGYVTYKIDKFYDLDDSIELREIKTKIVKTVKRERILPFISGCIFVVYFIDTLFS